MSRNKANMPILESAISPMAIGEKIFLGLFPTHIMVGFWISPPLCPLQFVRVMLPLQLDVRASHSKNLEQTCMPSFSFLIGTYLIFFQGSILLH